MVVVMSDKVKLPLRGTVVWGVSLFFRFSLNDRPFNWASR